MIRRARPGLGTLVEITLAQADTDAVAGHNSSAPGGGAAVTEAAVTEAAVTEAAFTEAAFTEAFAAIDLVQKLMSFHDADSELSRINRAPVGALLDIDPHTAQVLACAEQLRVDSGGLFDVACAAPLMASGFLPALGVAAPSAGTEVAAPAGAAYALIAPNRIQKLRAAPLDLGGIAKGYAVDLAIAALQQAGIKAACVNAGGDLRAYGDFAWPVLLRHPARPQQFASQTSLQNQALASSARYFAEPLHAIAAHTGPAQPQTSHLLNGITHQAICASHAVAVCAPDCMLADALCKVVFASADPQHPVLRAYGATAYIIAA
jgi:thiamine biosynthesis lipoprotein